MTIKPHHHHPVSVLDKLIICLLLHKGSANLRSYRVWIFHLKDFFFRQRTQTITTFLVFGVEQSSWYLRLSPARDLFIFVQIFRISEI